ncbi:MAG: nucleotidyltransferase domain-containing protein [Candidatus Cloacimonetes bacterium]|nr:nucleotidyltransferase domain-containing protein [Candidatus Cloacimonadota bacterium]
MLEYKKLLSEKLKKFWESDEKVYTAWEGGSFATGFDDDYSDLDIALICDDDHVEGLFEKTEKFLEDTYGIKEKLRMPEPSWHGHSQTFYLLKDSPQFFYIDLLIEKLSAGNRFMESNRHGNSVVWFDKKGLMDGTPMPDEDFKKKIVPKLEYFKKSFFITKIELEKQVLRGRDVDALDGYYKLILGRLAFLLNVKNRPAKHDFGLLYSYRDWPREYHEFVQKLLYVKDFKDLKIKLPIVINKVEELTNSLYEEWGN